jgi:hypothetical protein
VPGRGDDIALELICVTAGAVMGGLAGLSAHLRLAQDGRAPGRAGWLAASLWIAGVGIRLGTGSSPRREYATAPRLSGTPISTGWRRLPSDTGKVSLPSQPANARGGETHYRQIGPGTHASRPRPTAGLNDRERPP